MSSNDLPSVTTTSIARSIASSRKTSRPRMRCLKDSKKIASSSRMRSPTCSRAKTAECSAGWSRSDPSGAGRIREVLTGASRPAFKHISRIGRRKPTRRGRSAFLVRDSRGAPMSEATDLISGDALKAAAQRFLGEVRAKIDQEQGGLLSIFDSWLSRVLTNLSSLDRERPWEESVNAHAAKIPGPAQDLQWDLNRLRLF